MLSVGILIFDHVEILDFSGPYEVFSTASRVHTRLSGVSAPFRCFLVADEMRPVHARGGMQVLPDCVLPPPADIDVLIVPGGDVSKIIGNSHVLRWIHHCSREAILTASVCTGSFLLAEAGLLNGRKATTHWEDQAELQERFPEVNVRPDVAWVDCGKVVTSGGISAGIDMSLHLVERLGGTELAHATARQMEYRWNPHGTNKPAQQTDSGLFLAA